MKNLFPLSNTIVFCIIAMQSCLIDVPPSPASQKNDPDVIIPPVVNSSINDSVASLIDYKDTATIFLSGTINNKVQTILKSTYHLGFQI